MNNKYKIESDIYEAPSMACCAVSVERGYSSSKRGDLENLGDTKEEGDW